MADITCHECGAVMDQSDGCTHVCPPDPLVQRIEILEAQVRSLQLAQAAGVAALRHGKDGKP